MQSLTGSMQTGKDASWKAPGVYIKVNMWYVYWQRCQFEGPDAYTKVTIWYVDCQRLQFGGPGSVYTDYLVCRLS